jgi:capsular polysaccharide biosynthesis protein
VTMPDRRPGETPGPAWVFTDLAGASTRPVEFALGLASLPYVGTALRRRIHVWLATGLLGLIIGLGMYVKAPPPYQAVTSVLVAQPGDVNALDAIQTDVTLAKARSVAGSAMQALKLSGNIGKFLTSYTVTAVTDQVVQFTAGAPDSSAAVLRAKALAQAFLAFNAVELKAQEQVQAGKLGQQLVAAKQQQNAADGKYNYLKAHHTAGTVLDRAGITAADDELEVKNLEQAIADNQVSTTALVKGSRILDPAAAVPRSKMRVPAMYAFTGLLAGLTVGVIYVMVGSLMTDRLRRRDDVARAIGAPVRLSVGPVPVPSRWRPGRRGLGVTRSRDVQRVATQMRALVPNHAGGRAATLAIVAVDNPRLAALPVLAMAIGQARGGFQVVLADLSAGAAAARLLGVTGPGVRIVTAEGQQFALVVPGPGDLSPEGPLRHVTDTARIRPDYATRPLAAAYQSADLLLTLVTVDPGVGADYLTTWATDAVAIVTSGESSATRIHAAGEMMRQAHLPVSAAFLLGADKNDLSVGGTENRAARNRPVIQKPPAQVGASS